MILKEISHHLHTAVTVLRDRNSFDICILDASLLSTEQRLQIINCDASELWKVGVRIDSEKAKEKDRYD